MPDNDFEQLNNGWREFKLFISSTFLDMHAERDYLIRYVFPRVRQDLLKKRIYFIDIDLRWGILNEEDVIGACRAIIDESRPLFLGVIAGRYGFVPPQNSLKISVTEDEITYAIQSMAKDSHNNLFFLFRDVETTLSIKEEYAGQFRELEGSEQEQKLSLSTFAVEYTA